MTVYFPFFKNFFQTDADLTSEHVHCGIFKIFFFKTVLILRLEHFLRKKKGKVHQLGVSYEN